MDSLQQKLKANPKGLTGNKGYRRYLKTDKDSVSIDQDKIEVESRFDGKWVLLTNTDMSAEEVALKYKELWQVEQAFRDIKSILETRPVYHKREENIRRHVFCSFLALVLRKELERRLGEAGHRFEWTDIKQGLNQGAPGGDPPRMVHLPWRSERNVPVCAARSSRRWGLPSRPRFSYDQGGSENGSAKNFWVTSMCPNCLVLFFSTVQDEPKITECGERRVKI